jgi:hypothetical protein
MRAFSVRPFALSLVETLFSLGGVKSPSTSSGRTDRRGEKNCARQHLHHFITSSLRRSHFLTFSRLCTSP